MEQKARDGHQKDVRYSKIEWSRDSFHLTPSELAARAYQIGQLEVCLLQEDTIMWDGEVLAEEL